MAAAVVFSTPALVFAVIIRLIPESSVTRRARSRMGNVLRSVGWSVLPVTNLLVATVQQVVARRRVSVPPQTRAGLALAALQARVTILTLVLIAPSLSKSTVVLTSNHVTRVSTVRVSVSCALQGGSATRLLVVVKTCIVATTVSPARTRTVGVKSAMVAPLSVASVIGPVSWHVMILWRRGMLSYNAALVHRDRQTVAMVW